MKQILKPLVKSVLIGRCSYCDSQLLVTVLSWMLSGFDFLVSIYNKNITMDSSWVPHLHFHSLIRVKLVLLLLQTVKVRGESSLSLCTLFCAKLQKQWSTWAVVVHQQANEDKSSTGWTLMLSYPLMKMGNKWKEKLTVVWCDLLVAGCSQNPSLGVTENH